MSVKKPIKEAHLDTQMAHLGREPNAQFGLVNPGVYHASTVVSDTVEEQRQKRAGPGRAFVYGRRGSPTSFSFEEAVATLEGGDHTITVGSGLAAICSGFLAFLKSGDHVLVCDSAYGPIRRFCDGFLSRFGVETTYYDPLIGAGIGALIKPNTKIVYVESPGSHTFELQDIPAIAEVAHAANIPVVIDNTWSAGVYFKPFEHGCDVSLHAATKYLVGHSDAMLGVITTTDAFFENITDSVFELGYNVAPDDAYLGLRGLRTLTTRLERHQENALKVAHWFEEQAEIERVLHPALPSCPGHEFWKRDFTGSSGLFSVIFKEMDQASLEKFVDGLELFGLGGSWGGFESLVLPTNASRTATDWPYHGRCIRFHIGLEDPADLIDDLGAGLKRLSA